MNADEAESALADQDLVACLQAPLSEIKEIREACLDADIPVLLQRDDACCGAGKGGCGCAPKLQLLSRPDDVARIGRVMQSRWREMARREGTLSDESPMLAAPEESEDPPCPACGTAAPLAAGACSDCGLQLA